MPDSPATVLSAPINRNSAISIGLVVILVGALAYDWNDRAALRERIAVMETRSETWTRIEKAITESRDEVRKGRDEVRDMRVEIGTLRERLARVEQTLQTIAKK